MRGIEKIVNQILDEAKEKESKILAEAQETAESIMKNAQAEAAEIAENIRKKSETDIADYEAVAVLGAEQRKKRAVLKAKQEFIGNIIDKTYNKVLSSDDSEYFSLMLKMIEKNVLPEKGEIVFSNRDRKRMKAEFVEDIKEIAAKAGGKLKLSEEERKIDGGFILIYGGIEENCSLKAIFDAAEEEIRDLVNEKVFVK